MLNLYFSYFLRISVVAASFSGDCNQIAIRRVNQKPSKQSSISVSLKIQIYRNWSDYRINSTQICFFLFVDRQSIVLPTAAAAQLTTAIVRMERSEMYINLFNTILRFFFSSLCFKNCEKTHTLVRTQVEFSVRVINDVGWKIKSFKISGTLIQFAFVHRHVCAEN